MDADSNEQSLNLDQIECFENRLSLDFGKRLNFGDDKVLVLEEDESKENLTGDEEEEGEDDEEEEEEEEFSFTFGGELPSPVAADDAFSDGQIKAVFPLFKQALLYSDDSEKLSVENFPARPPVKKVFVETSEDRVAAAVGKDEIVGPYCEWSNRKAVEASDKACKKSNSTGFSKIWRFKDFRGRCNSDGRDAFVFLNNSAATHPPSKTAAKNKAEPIAEDSGVKVVRRVKKSGKSKTTPLSAHEAYLKSKAREGERRRRPSYLPYRPELVGFFTTVNGGGLTRNVHPF